MVSEPTYHPFASTVKLDTYHQKQVRKALLATMDPELCAYLDKMSSDAVARADKMNNDVNTILKALVAHTARIDSLTTWKPDLEAYFAKLELSVSTLQATPPATRSSVESRRPRQQVISTDNQATMSRSTPGGLRGCNSHHCLVDALAFVGSSSDVNSCNIPLCWYQFQGAASCNLFINVVACHCRLCITVAAIQLASSRKKCSRSQQKSFRGRRFQLSSSLGPTKSAVSPIKKVVVVAGSSNLANRFQ